MVVPVSGVRGSVGSDDCVGGTSAGSLLAVTSVQGVTHVRGGTSLGEASEALDRVGGAVSRIPGLGVLEAPLQVVGGGGLQSLFLALSVDGVVILV